MKPSHAHVLACLFAEAERRGESGDRGAPLRILDIGCGYGGLIADAMDAASEEGLELELYGFEINEHGAGRERYLEETLQLLKRRHTSIGWEKRIRIVSSKEDWPFETGVFDGVISNQVLEHVEDLDRFFGQQQRVLKTGGIVAHHFPSAESLVDPHSGVPFAHWPRSDEGRAANLKFFSRIGIGKYRRYRRSRGHSLNAFVEEFTDYLRRFTYFRSIDKVLDIGAKRDAYLETRYNWALARRWVSGDASSAGYESSLPDLSFARALARFASVTLVSK